MAAATVVIAVARGPLDGVSDGGGGGCGDGGVGGFHQ